jgi:transposase, IS5 family
MTQNYTLFSTEPSSYEWYFFKNQTELGEIYAQIDWDNLAELLPKDLKLKGGAPSWLNRKGMMGLMFLKHYTSLSDEKLIEQLNTNFAFQFFCNFRLQMGEKIKDKTLVSRVRKYIGEHCNFDKFQSILATYWKPEMKDTHVVLMDATCYEVNIEFPTDVKLLWEACQWIWDEIIPDYCKSLKIAQPRSKFKEQKKIQLGFQKLRKVGIKRTKRRIKALLYLLNKGIDALQEVFNQSKQKPSKQISTRFKTIKKMYQQQQYMFQNKKTSVKDRIVSLSQDHIRPIVRGKTNKPIEFGIKAHVMQVDGVNFIEYHSFNAFNETTRLQSTVRKHQELLGECTHLGADGIYPTNKNRKYCSSKKIQTNFVKKGPVKDDKPTKKIKALLNKERSTRLEGSFGTEKEHYGLRKIKAKTPKTQIVWMYFGVSTANAVLMAKRKAQKDKIPIKKAA